MDKCIDISDPRFLELEMTESLLVQNAEENVAVLRKLGQDGVRIAVDDFGTGYSSLSYLRQLPIDTIKIDRSFVRDLETDPEDRAIIQAIIAMAHSLELQVTAEGVETRGQLEALARMGCDEYQGYLFSRPLPAAEIAARFLAPGEWIWRCARPAVDSRDGYVSPGRVDDWRGDRRRGGFACWPAAFASCRCLSPLPLRHLTRSRLR